MVMACVALVPSKWVIGAGLVYCHTSIGRTVSVVGKVAVVKSLGKNKVFSYP